MKMKGRLLYHLFLISAVLMMLTACGNSNGLADCFDETALKTEAKAAIDDFNNKEYQNIIDKGNALFVSSMSLEQWQASCDPYLEKVGTFEKIEKIVLAGQQGSDGNDYAVVIAVAKYSEGKIQFSIVYDTDMKLAQFFIQ